MSVLLSKYIPYISLQWAERTFRVLYFDEAAALLQEHPAGSADEEGLPFWGG